MTGRTGSTERPNEPDERSAAMASVTVATSSETNGASSPVLFNAGATLRLNQDCLDIVIEFAVSTPEALRQFRLLAAPFARAVDNLLFYQLCRRRLTGPQPHPGGASLTLRGIDGVRLQLPTASDEQVMRIVLGVAGRIITRFDPRAFRYFSPTLNDGEIAHARLRGALQRMPALTEADVRVAPGQEGHDFGVASVLRLPSTVTELSLPGASPRFLDAVAAAVPQIEDLQLPSVTADDDSSPEGSNHGQPPSLHLPNLDRVYLGNAENELAMRFLHRFALTTTLSNVNLPFQHLDLKDATVLAVINGPSVRRLRTTEHPEWKTTLPPGLTAETLQRLEVLHGFIVPQSALSSLTSLQNFGFRLPAESVLVRRRSQEGPIELPLVTSYGAELAKACGTSLVGISLDVDRPDAAAVVDAFANGYAAEFDDRSTRCPVRSFRTFDVAATRQTEVRAPVQRMRPVPLRAFRPQHFPELQTLTVKYSPWDATGLANEAMLAAEGAAQMTSTTPGTLKLMNVNAPASLELLTAIGRLAGGSLKTLEVETDYNNDVATVMDAAGALEAHFSALEYLTAPQLCVSGWKCSPHKMLRVVSVAVDRHALTEFIEQLAHCPLIERVRVRDVATGCVNGFDAGDHQPPYRNVLAPFRVHCCPRLVAVNGIYGCDPPREGGEFEFVLSSNAFCWELASFS